MAQKTKEEINMDAKEKQGLLGKLSMLLFLLVAIPWLFIKRKKSRVRLKVLQFFFREKNMLFASHHLSMI
jgi:hypothetical protein